MSLKIDNYITDILIAKTVREVERCRGGKAQKEWSRHPELKKKEIIFVDNTNSPSDSSLTNSPLKYEERS